LGDYRTGALSNPQWSSAFVYSKGFKVISKQVIYISLVDSNTTEPPSSSWEIYLPSYIGVDERILYNGQKLVLEYALNRFYFTNFRQPPLVSDIYINNAAISALGFLVGSTEPFSSTVALTDIATDTDWSIGTYPINTLRRHKGRKYLSKVNNNSDEPPSAKWHQTDTVMEIDTFGYLSNFTIFVPSAKYYSSLPSAPSIELELRNFVDKIIPAGITYTVTPY
jgi:hypothetical protein